MGKNDLIRQTTLIIAEAANLITHLSEIEENIAYEDEMLGTLKAACASVVLAKEYITVHPAFDKLPSDLEAQSKVGRGGFPDESKQG